MGRKGKLVSVGAQKKRIPAPASTGKNRNASGQFTPGNSGNPVGRPIGSKNRASLILEDMLDEHGPELAKAFIQAALKGNVEVLKCFAHLVLAPRKHRHRKPMNIGPLLSLADALTAQRQITIALAEGDIDDDQAA